ncbi:MAG TPA: MotA/TolQ/ExbB proton channel family protein [Chthoniobacterales bacterium]|jgi:biopolymer transport protein ExbB
MIELMQRGGVLMWVIAFCSVLATGIFLERFFFFHRSFIEVSEFLNGLANLIRRKNYSEARHECAVTHVPVARVLHAAILRYNSSRADLKEIVQEAGQLEVPLLEKHLPALSTITFITPMIGFLGTVTGLLQAFATISANNGYTSAIDISGAIYQSLLTTAAGIAVAIPAFVGHQYLSSRVDRLMRDMERAGIEIVNLLTDPVNLKTDIISFEEQTKKLGL